MSTESAPQQSRRTFALPDLGEGLTGAEIIEWLVSEGAEVRVDDPLVVVETVKSVTDLPSPWSGRVVELCARAGDHLAVGADLFVLDADIHDDAAGPQHLVGTPPAAPPVVIAAMPTKRADARVMASPAVRRLARRLNVDLRSMTGTGPDGIVTADDVESAANDEPTSR